MNAILVGRDERSGRLEGSLKRTAPSPTAKRRAGIARTRSASASGASAAGASSGAPAAPGGGERLAAAGVEHREHERGVSAPRASASSVLTPTTGSPRPCASARAVAMPIRRPVKLPGPTPTASRSTSSQPTPARRQRLLGGGQQPRGVRRARPRRRVVAHLDDAPSARSTPATVGGRRGVEAEHDHDAAAAGRRPRARAPRAARPAARPAAPRARARSGHSTNVTGPGPK